MGKSAKNSGALPFIERESFGKRLARNYKEHKVYYWLAVPIIAYYIIFHYLPMFGVVIAFQNYRPAKGLLGSSWVGLKHFKAFFDSIYAGRLIKNTLMINLLLLIFSFPAPIILALLLNELRSRHYKNTLQVIYTFPNFLSWVIVGGLMTTIFAGEGVINSLIRASGGQTYGFLTDKSLIRPLLYATSIWKGTGWSAILYLAGIAGISPELYEAAEVDGANRFHKMWYITWPEIRSTAVILLILAFGGIMSKGYDQILNMTNAVVRDAAETIDTYIYRITFQEKPKYGFSTAIGLSKSVINFAFLLLANKLAKALGEGGIM